MSEWRHGRSPAWWEGYNAGYDIGYEDSQSSYEADVACAIDEGWAHPGIAVAGAYWLGMLGFALAALAVGENLLTALRQRA